MMPATRQSHESLEVWEARLIAEQPQRERAQQRDIVMNMPEHEYRRRKAEACAPPRLHVPNLPDCKNLTDEEYAAVKAKAGYHRQSLR